MSEFTLGQNGKFGSIDLDKLKSGITKQELGIENDKELSNIFDEIDNGEGGSGKGNGKLERNELAVFIQKIRSLANDDNLSKDEAKEFNTNGEKIGKNYKQLYSFINKLASLTEDISSVKAEKDRETIVFKDGHTEQILSNGNRIIIKKDDKNRTIVTVKDENDNVLEESIDDGKITTTTYKDPQTGKRTKETVKYKKTYITTIVEYEEDGETPKRKTVLDLNCKTEYIYNKDSKKYIPQSAKTNTIIDDKERVEYTEYDTDRSDDSIRYIKSNTITENGQLIEKTVYKNGKAIKAEYDGQGNTYIIVQPDETTVQKIAEKFNCNVERLVSLNDGKIAFTPGEKIKLPGIIEPNDKILDGRLSSEDAKAKFDEEKTQEAAKRAKSKDFGVPPQERGETSGTGSVTGGSNKKSAKTQYVKRTLQKDKQTLEELAKWWYKKQKNVEPTNDMVKQIVKQMKAKNPHIKGSTLRKGDVVELPIDSTYKYLDKMDNWKNSNKFITFADNKSKTWEEVAMHLFINDGINILGITDPRVKERAEDLRKLNPKIKLPNTTGKKITARVPDETQNRVAKHKQDVEEIKLEKSRQYDTKSIRQASTKLANDLYEALYDRFSGGARTKASKLWDNKDNSVTKSLLQKITPENAAFVVQAYQSIAKHSLAKDISTELIGLNINDIKNNICKNLVIQAKKLGLKGIHHSAYMNTNDIDKITSLIDKVSKQIVECMESHSVDPNKETATCEWQGSTMIKTISNGPKFQEAGIVKIVEEYNQAGQKQNARIFYNDGKEVYETYEVRQNKNGREEVVLTERKLVKHGSKSAQKDKGTNITEAVPMEIELPNNASEKAKEFARALEKNKAFLMKKLNIDNDTYNMLARIAMAIAEQETNFGKVNPLSFGGAKEGIAQLDTLGRSMGTGMSGHQYSFGMTQIKFEQWKEELYAVGITQGADLLNTETSAIGTLAILATINKRIHHKEVQDAIEAANGRVISHTGWAKNPKTGKLEKNYKTEAYVNEVTDFDAICYYYNTGGKQIRKGTADPAGNSYTNNTRQYVKKYSIKENPADREAAISRSRDSKASRENVRNFKPMDNNGPIGSIVFMPKMYSDKPINKYNEMGILKQGLADNNNIKQSDKNLLIEAVEKGEISFEFGLTAKEVASLKQADVDKLLKHLNNLKQYIEANSKVKFSDGINNNEAYTIGSQFKSLVRDAEYKFKREYLNSISPQVNLSDVNEKSVLMSPLSNSMDYSTSALRRGFAGSVGDKGIRDKGVNQSNTSKASAALAKYSEKVANRMHSAGYCLQGVRTAMKEAGMDVSDWSEGTPRGSVYFFERHPDLFEEVKWINVGNGKGRQINSTDLPNLPAGYIVIWVPDANYSKEPGHISITNGNGQAYADETDNLDWGAYSGATKSGKGEHGHFRVFRLTDKWKVNSITGKLKL